jgi:undecaprenyl-diphosphatase
MDEYIRVLILAVIQGAAELLPVSSSAHVIVAQKLMGLDPSKPEQTFVLIMLHTGTMFAVIVYFWPRWKQLLGLQRGPRADPQKSEARYPDTMNGTELTSPSGSGQSMWARYRFLWLSLLATVVSVALYGPVWLAEKVTHSEVEELFKRLDLIGLALACAGVLILVAGFLQGKVKQAALSVRTAIVIGVVQAICLPFRGFSRSGATISAGLLLGLPRAMAEDFSFALAVLITPAAIAKMVLRLLKIKDEWTWSLLLEKLLPGLVGMAFSFGAGYLALQLLSAVLERGRWWTFGVYCLVAAAVLVTLWWYGW